MFFCPVWMVCTDCGAKIYNHRGKAGNAHDWAGRPNGKRRPDRDKYNGSRYDLGKQRYDNYCTTHLIRTAAASSPAGQGTLKQPVISLGIEKPLFVKAGFLKPMIHVGGNHKLVFVFCQIQKIVLNTFGSAPVTIYIDIPAPAGPKFFRRFVRVKSAGIHIVKPVCLLKIGKIPLSPS